MFDQVQGYIYLYASLSLSVHIKIHIHIIIDFHKRNYEMMAKNTFHSLIIIKVNNHGLSELSGNKFGVAILYIPQTNIKTIENVFRMMLIVYLTYSMLFIYFIYT